MISKNFIKNNKKQCLGLCIPSGEALILRPTSERLPLLWRINRGQSRFDRRSTGHQESERVAIGLPKT